MADSRLTLQKLINRFKPETTTEIVSISKIEQLDKIHFNTDFFIKDMDDKDFFPYLLLKMGNMFYSKSLQFFTWIETEDKAEYSNSSFWMFPVIFYKDNNIAEMVESVKSLVKFRKKVVELYNRNQGESGKVDEIIKVGIIGKYYKAFDEVASEADQKALAVMRRQAQIIKDNIEDEFNDGLKVYLVNHQYENQLKNWLFCESDIKKSEEFAEKLTKRDSPISTYIRSKLSQKAKELINDNSQIEMFIETLIADLNSKILKDTEFHSEDRFRNIDLSDDTKNAIKNGQDIIRRNRLLMEDAFKDEIENYKQIDILIFPNGFMGNMLYRAWISMGYVKKAVSMAFHDKTHLPIYLGKSIYDPRNDIEKDFASACKGLKEEIKEATGMMDKRCALITTNQVDICIRALSGLIQGARLPKPVMFNLSTGTGTYPEKYPLDVKKQVLKVLKDNECSFLCFSIVDLFLIRTIDLMKYLKEETGLPVIVGGIHAELYPEETIGIKWVDAICTGEAYHSFITVLLEWKDRFKIDIPDFWFKSMDGSVKKNGLTPFYHGDDFKRIPMPDYSYVNYYLLDGEILKDISSTPCSGPFKVEQHQTRHNGSIIFSAMTGCSSHCSFCSITAHTKLRKEKGPHTPLVRQKPISIVRKELEAITKHNKNMKFLCVMENDFTCRGITKVKAYCENIRNICKVPFYTMVSPDTLNEDKLKIMIENGLAEINMGIQTNSDFNRQCYDREMSDELIQKKVRMINKYKDKVYPFYDFIIFNPEEHEESLRKTISLIKEFPLPFDFVSHHLTLGTETLLYKRLISKNKISSDEVKKTNSSDFHNFKFDDYKNWDTFYLNLFLEWLAGPHNDEWVGRIPRNLDKLKQTEFGICFFENKKINKIDRIDKIHADDIFTLFTETSFAVLNAPDNRGFLRELNDLLLPVRYSNQT